MSAARLISFFAAMALTAQIHFDRRQGGQPVQPPTPQMPTGKASIEGTVINQLTREPIKKVSVMLNGMASLTAVTDASGHFAFKDLAAGQYMLAAAQSRDYPGSISRIDFAARQTIKLSADEQNTGVTLSLVPAASIAGRVVDEEGSPLANCGVLAMQFQTSVLVARGSTSTNEKGEYRMATLPAGKYYVQAQCRQSTQMPHAFIRRGEQADVPLQVYPMLLYPGTRETQGATRITAAPGTQVSGIDFRMSPVSGLSLRGRVVFPDGDLAARPIQLMLESSVPSQRVSSRMSARVDPQTGEFRFQRVLPGSYQLTAITMGEGHPYYGQLAVEVGATQPEPVSLTLAATPSLSGVITLDNDLKVPFESMRVMLNSVDGMQYGMPSNSQVQKDGTFLLTGFFPGRWRLFVNGGPGYIKSIALNEQRVSGPILDLPQGVAGPLKVVLSNSYAQLDGTLSDAPSETGPVWGLLWPVDAGMQNSGLERSARVDGGHFATAGIVPGQYRACAIAVAEPWPVLQNPRMLKAMESRCTTLEIAAGEHKTIQIPFLPVKDLQSLADAAENDQ